MTALMLAYSPVYDDVTAILRSWVEGVAARYPGRVVVVGDGRDALYEALRSLDPELVWVATHGERSFVVDDRGRPALSACSTDELLSGRHVYLLSCLAGDLLAASASSKDAASVIGFTEPVYIVDDPRVLGHFGRCLSAPAVGLLEYGDGREAFEYAVEECSRVISELEGRGGVYDIAANLLRFDLQAMRLYLPGSVQGVELPRLSPLASLLAAVAVITAAVYPGRGGG